MNEYQDTLLSANRIDILGEVNRELAMYVRRAIILKISQGAPPITVHISSNGGSGGYGGDIFDLIRFYKGRSTAVVHGPAQSAAAVILQACDWRTITPNGNVLIHNMTPEPPSFIDTEDQDKLKSYLERVRLFQIRRYEIYSRRTGRTLEEVAEACNIGKTMSAEEALAFGLVDQIIASEVDIKKDSE